MVIDSCGGGRWSLGRIWFRHGKYISSISHLLSQRICQYCDSGDLDSEMHAIMACEMFNLKRQCFFGRVGAIVPNFLSLTNEQKLKTVLCPTNIQLGKCVSKYFGIISETRKEIDLGLQKEDLQLYIKNETNSMI